MNGYECGQCGCEPCACEKIAKKKRVRDGIKALEVGVDVICRLPHWKMVVIKWFWPDILKFIKVLFEYCMNTGEGPYRNYTEEMGVDWGISKENKRDDLFGPFI